jgi:hypothetical protein
MLKLADPERASGPTSSVGRPHPLKNSAAMPHTPIGKKAQVGETPTTPAAKLKRSSDAATPTRSQSTAAPKRREKSRTDRPNDSKQAKVIAMLRAPAGTSIVALMKATGWQQHSVRGFFAGVVRKKLKLNLSSKKVDGKRIYHIVGSGAGTGSRASGKRVS